MFFLQLEKFSLDIDIVVTTRDNAKYKLTSMKIKGSFLLILNPQAIKQGNEVRTFGGNKNLI